FLWPKGLPEFVPGSPLTVAANVLEHGTGALNIDGCRVDAPDGRPLIESKADVSLHAFGNGLNGSRCAGVTTQGRWPANLIHDGTEPADLLGEAARFFYCAKASKSDRGGENTHPTVKPTDLMRYLCRLVTPPGGVVLDPFMGSGSTGKAAVGEGFRFVGCEMSPEYMAIAKVRIQRALEQFLGDLA
ncbi:site-specific DNA-methyltransferase, partial [bacterium]|nr:site-specific DNA-methyltransferase [bacterium]